MGPGGRCPEPGQTWNGPLRRAGTYGPSVWTSGTESPFSSGDKEGPASFALRPTAEHVHWGYGGLTQTKKQGQVIIT